MCLKQNIIGHVWTSLQELEERKDTKKIAYYFHIPST